jgi:hypothetical protein
MIWGAIALSLYSVLVCQLLMRARLNALSATLAALPVWLMVAFSLHALFGSTS